MKRYYSPESTPLAFHKFFWYFLIPVGCVVLIIQFIIFLRDLTAIGGAEIVWMVFYLAAFVLFVTAIFKASRFKGFAWYFVMIFLGLNVVLDFVNFILHIPAGSDQIWFDLAQFILSSVYAVLIGIYYTKRKPLFFPDKIKPVLEEEDNPAGASALAAQPSIWPAVQQDATARADIASPQNEEAHPGFCRRCGKPIAALDSQFCKYCGTRIINDRTGEANGDKSHEA